MKKKIYISACDFVKSGVKDGRKWSLYKVIDQGGIQYSTFDVKYAGLVGQEIEVEIREEEVERNGRTYLNRTIIEPRRQANNSAEFEAKVMFLLNQINAKLNELTREDEPSTPNPLTTPQSPEVEDLKLDDF